MASARVLVSVHLKDILAAVKVNRKADISLATCRLRVDQAISDTFRSITSVQIQTPVTPIVQITPVPKKEPSMFLPLPVPVVVKPVLVPVVSKPPTPPPSPIPEPVKVTPKEAKVAPLAAIPSQTQIKRSSVDPLCIAIEQRDPMYAIANAAVQKSIECEEAATLEAKIDSLYKTESGRSRGWTKTALEKYFVSRAASGADRTFDWSAVWSDKTASALLDFICMAKSIRLFVWSVDVRQVGFWPAADPSAAVATNKEIRAYHVDTSGRTFNPPVNPAELQQQGWTLLAPHSVEHSLEKLTVDELENVKTRLGISVSLTGKKAERVRTLASARMALRFSGNSYTLPAVSVS